MIELHSWPTPNGLKISIFLEETALKHKIFPVNIGKGQQFDPHFLSFSPNNRIPAIRDLDPADGGEPVTVFESGAILTYLGDKTGQFLPPRNPRPERGDAMAVLADGRPGADGRAEPPLQHLCTRENRLRD